MSDYPTWPESDLRGHAAALSPGMRHVMLRCSEFTDWSAGHSHGIGRQWIDIVAGYTRGSMMQVRALIRRELVVETSEGLYALTLLGIAVRGRLIREGFRP